MHRNSGKSGRCLQTSSPHGLLFSVLNANVVRNQKIGPCAEEGVRLVWRQDELGLCASDARADVGTALVQVAQLG